MFEKYKKYKFWINTIILFCMFFVHCFFKNMCFIVYPILLLMVVLDNLENGISYLIMCLPFYLIRNFLSSILYFICVFAYIVKFFIVIYGIEKNKISKMEIIPIVTFLIYMLLPFGEYNLNLFLKVSMLTFVLAFVCAVLKKPQVLKLEKNVRILSVSLLISAMLSMLTFVSPWLQESLGKMDFSSLFRFKAMFNNVNVLAMMCEVVLALLIASIITKNKWYDWVLFVLISGLGITTFSKTFLILWALMLLILFGVFLKRKPIKTLIISIAVAGVVLIILKIKPDIYFMFKNRLIGYLEGCRTFEDVMNMVTTNRYGIWKGYITYIVSNPLVLFFGKGLGAYRLEGLNSTHNALLGCVYQLGIVGLILFVVAIILLVKANKKNSEKKKFNFALLVPIIILLLILQVEDMIFFINKL